MKSNLFLLVFVLLFISCKKEITEVKEVTRYSIGQFMDNETVFSSGFSPDNSQLLLTSNRSGIYNMYTVAASGGELLPLTQSDSASVYAVSYFPNDNRILFRMDGNGDEIYKLFVKDGENIQRLTPAQNVRALFYGWSKNEKSFYYGSNERNPRLTDIYQMDTETFTSTLVFSNDEAYDFGGISNTGKYIALSKSINTNDSDLFLYDTENKEFTKINTSQSGNSAQDFSINDDAFYYTTDFDGEFSYLMKYTIAEGSYEKVASKNWDIAGASLSHNGK